MLTLYYSPHMTSVDNEAGRASGHADVPLSAAGLEQSKELGRHYANVSLDAVFCSDLRRAYSTAEIAFAGRGVPIVRDARLREYDYGDMTQQPRERVEAELTRRVVEPFPGGESLLIVTRRVGMFLGDTLREYDGKPILVIGHRATRCALEYWCGDASLEAIVRAPWQWRDVPIWRYALTARDLERRALAG